MVFKDKLPIIRKEKHLSQEALAEIIGVTRQAVAKWELGQGFPDIENLIRLSDFFKIGIDQLVKEEDSHYFTSRCIKEASEDDELIRFLCTSKKSTYAAHGAETVPSRPNSHDLIYCDGEYKYIDTYLGGEKFAGEEAVWHNETPVWSMNYQGRVLSSSFFGDFLKEALLRVTEDLPYRGPQIYINGDYVYLCNSTGIFDWFQGYEEIFCKTEKIYECYFHGGRLK